MAYSTFLNRQIGEYSVAEVVSSSTDDILKKGQKIMTDDQVDQFIEITASLFQHLEEKDIFIEVYRIQLAKRLLNDKILLEFEKQFIGRIKMSCGPMYT